MARVRRTVRPHPATVTAVSRGPRTRKRTTTKRAVIAPPVVTKMDPRVWKKALELAEGDRSRIEVLSSTDCIVHNPGWKKGS